MPLVLQARRHLVNVLDLVDGDALVGQMQHLVVEMPIGVALVAQHLLDPVFAPVRPMV